MTVAQVETLDVSVLVPAKDEADNLPEFLQRCAQALEPAGFSFEVIIVNDGSRDGTDRVLQELGRQYRFLSVVTHRRQRGIAEALRSAGDVARGDVYVFYPADLQYLPEDIPALVAPILQGKADIVTGTKQGKYEKAFVSSVYNGLCRWLFGVGVTDLNSVKAYRREVMLGVPLRPDWHRYMVVIAAADGYMMAHALAQLAPLPERVVMVGDRAHDVEGAAAHGIGTVVVDWGYGNADFAEVMPVAPAAHVATVDDLREVLGV